MSGHPPIHEILEKDIAIAEERGDRNLSVSVDSAKLILHQLWSKDLRDQRRNPVPVTSHPVGPDQWVNRGLEMTCASCVFCVPKGDTGIGRCRRHAPTMNGWPVMYPKDWCGDHKLKEAQHG